MNIVTLPNLADASSAQSMGIDMHLGQMVELLCQEEEERDPKDPGSMVGGEKLLLSMRCTMVVFSLARVLVWSLCCNIRYWTLSTPLQRVT